MHKSCHVYVMYSQSLFKQNQALKKLLRRDKGSLFHKQVSRAGWVVCFPVFGVNIRVWHLCCRNYCLESKSRAHKHAEDGERERFSREFWRSRNRNKHVQWLYFVIFFCGIDMSWRGMVGTMTLQLSTALKFRIRYANELITMQQAFPWSPSSSAKSRVKGLRIPQHICWHVYSGKESPFYLVKFQIVSEVISWDGSLVLWFRYLLIQQKLEKGGKSTPCTCFFGGVKGIANKNEEHS